MVVRIEIGRELRLATMQSLIRDITAAYSAGAEHIELDVSGMESISEGARRLLVTATARLGELGVNLVLVE